MLTRTCTIVALLIAWPYPASAENWPMWRGPRGDGTSLEENIPTHWSGTENIAWKTPISGKGHASPIVWNDRVFVVTARKETKQRLLLCLDRSDGRILWQRMVLEAPLERINSLNSYASSTPATDGERVYVSFLDVDTMFIAAYDFEGHQVWAVHPGTFSSMHGYCSSPVLWQDNLIVNGDQDGDGYLVALDRATGKTVWKTPRPNHTRSYCTPLVAPMGGRNQAVLSGSKCVAGYDPDTGAPLWIIDGPTEQFVASLVYNGDLLFMTCGFPQFFLQAIRPDGTGNVTRTHVVWQKEKDCAYVPSPVAVGAYFLVVSDTGIARCLEAASGRDLWRQRLGPHYSASLVAGNGLVYFLSDKGVMTVIRPGPNLEIVARNELGEETYASPAISAGQIFLRGLTHLYCIGMGSSPQ
jgi:outer membrane protein assembly factor BamB